MKTNLTDGLTPTLAREIVADALWTSNNFDRFAPAVQRELLDETWKLQDGYGIAGHTPPQGWDWSGIRDSSDAAALKMAECVLRIVTAKGGTVAVEVEMLAFGGGAIRTVDVPRAEWTAAPDVTSTRRTHLHRGHGTAGPVERLGLIFKYGQNDFQPKPFPSVSVGDVIRYDGARYKVEGLGFARI